MPTRRRFRPCVSYVPTNEAGNIEGVICQFSIPDAVAQVIGDVFEGFIFSPIHEGFRIGTDFNYMRHGTADRAIAVTRRGILDVFDGVAGSVDG